jgi:hypothetical protein
MNLIDLNKLPEAAPSEHQTIGVRPNVIFRNLIFLDFEDTFFITSSFAD